MTSDTVASCPVDDASPSRVIADRSRAHRPLSLRLNFSWMLVANVVYAGCQWGMLSVVAKLGTPAMVGQFVLALAVTTPVMALCTLQLRTVLATDAKKLDFQFGDYLALRLATTTLALVGIGGICLVSGYRPEVVLIIAVAAISAAVDSISDIVHGRLQQRERMDRIAQSLMIKGFLALPGLAVAILITGQVIYAIAAIAVARLGVLIVWDLPRAAGVSRSETASATADRCEWDSLSPRWVPRRMITLFLLSLPLGLVMMLISLSNNVPRYFIEHYLGEASLGIFGAIAYLGLVGKTAVGALGQSATPRLAQHFASGNRAAFGSLLLKLCAIGALMGVAGVVITYFIGPLILNVAYGPEYARHNNILVWAMIAAGISYVASFVGYGITAARYFRVQIPLFAIVAAAAAAACWWLVPQHGLVGAVWALGVAALTQLVGSGLVVLHAMSRIRD